MFLPRKNIQKCAKKVENVNFDTLLQPFWIPPFFGGGTLVFELFSTFSSKIGSRGIKLPIYPEFMMIWNYALKITPYSPPLVLIYRDQTPFRVSDLAPFTQICLELRFLVNDAIYGFKIWWCALHHLGANLEMCVHGWPLGSTYVWEWPPRPMVYNYCVDLHLHF